MTTNSGVHDVHRSSSLIKEGRNVMNADVDKNYYIKRTNLQIIHSCSERRLGFFLKSPLSLSPRNEKKGSTASDRAGPALRVYPP